LFNKKRLIETFFDLLKIKSPSGSEKGVSEYITDRLVGLGLDVINDNIGKRIGSDSGNIIAHFRGKKKAEPIFFAAHMDTVQPMGEILPIISGERIINTCKDCILGCDDKSAIAAMIETMHDIVENDIETNDLYLVFTICEEIGLKGSKNMDLSLLKADIGFVFDADGGVGSIITQAPFQDSIDIRFIGKPAHAGICPEKGLNSIVAASKAISRAKTGRLDKNTTCNIGVIKGGVAKNIVPELTEIEAEARSMDERKLKMVIEDITKIFKKSSEETGVRFEYKVLREYNGYRLSKNDLPVRMAIRALKNIGMGYKLKKTGGGSDTNIFNSKGKKAVNLSSGMENCHTNEEFIKISELLNLTRLITELSKSS
jgi:tripeptide aminopeptidase